MRVDLPGRAPGGRAADRSPMLSLAGGDGRCSLGEAHARARQRQPRPRPAGRRASGQDSARTWLAPLGPRHCAVARRVHGTWASGGDERRDDAAAALRELKERGYGAATPPSRRAPRAAAAGAPVFEVRFETRRRPGAGRLRPVPGGVRRRAGGDPDRWLFSLVLGYSCRLWASALQHEVQPGSAASWRLRALTACRARSSTTG